MYESILVAHLIGAGATALLVLCTLFALHKRSASFYRTCAVTLGSLAAFEIASGAALAVLSTELSVGLDVENAVGSERRRERLRVDGLGEVDGAHHP